ncbi:MAG: metallophosphoesterase [Polyangiaceae bacterium]|nr:metallophosphoesterase [Polyangiaceae bacterium]
MRNGALDLACGCSHGTKGYTSRSIEAQEILLSPTEHPHGAGRPNGAICASLTHPIVVVADLHLEPSCNNAAAHALPAVLGRHRGAELVCAGDSFNLSVEPTPDDAARRLAAILRAQTSVRDAIRQRLVQGARVTLIAGNHDAALVTDRVRDAFRDLLEVQRSTPLVISPWFVRRGPIHIEHGHVYDPDNAPVHPLVRWSSDHEPLGIALTRRVLAPTNAMDLDHAHETTPLAGLRRTLRLFGPRGLTVVARYFGVSMSLCWQAMTGGECAAARQRAERDLDPFAATSGLDRAAVQRLLRAAPAPTHRNLPRTFRRLYLDRASAAAVLLGAGGVGLLGAGPPAWATAAAAAAYLVLSARVEGTSRYTGVLEQRLRAAAHIVAELSGASLVVFGHTHCEDSSDGYINPGAFGFPRAETPRYVLIREDGRGKCLSVGGV